VASEDTGEKRTEIKRLVSLGTT